ncbi:MAG: phage tail family protein [Clostridia bacterium]|nr:phage tail family protein [Clostridia bacterium]
MGLFNLSRFNLVSGDVSPTNQPVLFGEKAIGDAVPRSNVLAVRIGAPKIETTAITPGISSGLMFSRNRHSSRTIEIEIELPLERETYPENMRKARAWAISSEPQKLVLSAYKGRYIYATCTGLNEFDQKEWWEPVVVTFECWDPYFVSANPSSAAVGASFTIEGDKAPDAQIIYNLASGESLVNPQWTFDGGKYIKLNTTVTGGEIKIDLKTQCVSRNDVSLMQYLVLGSRFPELEPGTHIITGPSGGTISWHERWL